MRKSSGDLMLQSRFLIITASFVCLMICLVSCKKGIEEKQKQLNDGSVQPIGIVVNYPQNKTIFPPELPAPEFSWKDTLYDGGEYYIFFITRDGKELFSEKVNTFTWRPDSLAWKSIKYIAGNEDVIFSIVNSKSKIFSKKYSSGRIHFSFSPDSVGASVFYRAVPLPFSYAVKHVNEIEWYLGGIDGEKPRKVLDNIPVCANCHSFSQDGSKFAMDVDYANDKGSYIITPVKDTLKLTFDKIITWSDYKREDGEKTYGLLSQISPDGRYVLSTVKDRSVFIPVDNLEYSQLFFPIKGILAVYDRDQRKFYELQGANDKSLVQSNPNWSPDGNEILFSRAARYYNASIDNSSNIIIKPEDARELLSGQKDFKFDLYRLDFNKGDGGVAEPVPGASNNNFSNYFARYSPDGKWIVFCQAENFMLLQPDSKLYIMSAKDGTPRRMNCNTGNMNSWHSWSPNGKWLVFSSKKKGPYTQLYLTHVDEKGNDSPAVLLENLAFGNKAANIPEFFDDSKHDLKKMVDAFSNAAVYFTSLAANNFENKEFITGLANIKKAIDKDSTFFDAYLNRIIVSIRIGQKGTRQFIKDKNTAIQLITKQHQQRPNDASLLMKKAQVEYFTDENDAALKDILAAIKMNPEHYDSHFLLASIYQRMGQIQKLMPCYMKMLKIRPGDKQTTYYMGLYYQNTGKLDKALSFFNELISKYPNNPDYHFSKANLLAMQGKKEAAKSSLDKFISLDVNNFEGYIKRGFFWSGTGEKDRAATDFNRAVSLLTESYNKNLEDVELLVLRSQILEQNGNLEGALADCEEYLSLIPLNYNVLKQKAGMELSGKKWSKALKTITLLIENFPVEPAFLTDRCFVNLQLGNRKQAIVDLNEVQRILNNNMDVLYNVAMLKSTIGDKAGAEKDLSTIVSFLSEKKKKGSLSKAESQLLFKASGQLI